MLLGALLSFVLFMGVVWAGCSTFLKNNRAYERGVETALKDSIVAEALGAPVEEGWFLNGTVEGDGIESRGVWRVRLVGADRSGTLQITGLKRGGDWRVVAMSLKVDEGFYTYVSGKGFAEDDGDEGTGPPDILD